MQNEGKELKFCGFGFNRNKITGILIIVMVLLCNVCRAEFDNTNVLVEKAVSDIYQGKFQQAYAELKQAYEQSPRHPRVHFNLGRLFELTGNYSEGLKEYQIAVILDPSLVSARRGIARCTVELKRGTEPQKVISQTQSTYRPATDRVSSPKLSGPVVSQVFNPMPSEIRSTETTESRFPMETSLPKNYSTQLPHVQTPSLPKPVQTSQIYSAPGSSVSQGAQDSGPKMPVEVPQIDDSSGRESGFVMLPRGNSNAPRQTRPQPVALPTTQAANARASLPSLPVLPTTSTNSFPGTEVVSSPPKTRQIELTSVPPMPEALAQEVRSQPKNQKLLSAETLLESGNPGRVIEMLEPEMANTENPQVLFLLGKAYSMKGELFAAIKSFEEVLKIDEKNYDAYYLLAQNYAKVNLLDDALKNYKAYFAVKPQAGVAVEIGRVFERIGNNEEAQNYYSKANAMNPGNPQLQSRVGNSRSKAAEDLYLRANHALTTDDFFGAGTLFEQALEQGGLTSSQERDSRRKIGIAKLRVEEMEKAKRPAQNGFGVTRKTYGTVNLRYAQLSDIDFHTRFTDPVVVEWSGFIAKSFKRYGRDFLLVIKELSRDELDEMEMDRNNFKLNQHYNNQPLFLLIARQGAFPGFMKEGALVTFTGQTDWKKYDVVNDFGQTVKLTAFEFLSGYPR